MRLDSVKATLVFACLSFSIGWSNPALGCSVCQPGDPLFSGDGASAQQQGSLSLYLQTQQFSKQSGALPHHDEAEAHHEDEGIHADGLGEHTDEGAGGRDRERSRQRETNLFASWTPADRLTLTARVPFRSIRIREEPHDETNHTARNSGIGDVSLFATGVLWRNRPVLPSRWIEGRLMLKAPTGRRDERIEGELDPHLQLGTGSWDWGAGLASVNRFDRGSLYLSTFYRFNSRGSLDYEYGDVFLANAAWTTDGVHLAGFGGDRTRMGIELNFRSASRDRFRSRSYRHSGGSILYASPFVELKLSSTEKSPQLRLGTRMPLGSGGLNGDQREDFIFDFGLRLPF